MSGLDSISLMFLLNGLKNFLNTHICVHVYICICTPLSISSERKTDRQGREYREAGQKLEEGREGETEKRKRKKKRSRSNAFFWLSVFLTNCS